MYQFGSFDVVITSRSHGSYRLVPVRESDTEQGKVHRIEEGESVDGFLKELSKKCIFAPYNA